jgi:DNA-directed RNA polymerase specialized sigma24 family protein
MPRYRDHLRGRAGRFAPSGKWIGWLARLQGMGHDQDEFADFYRSSRDSCLRAVTVVVGDRDLAEEQVAEAYARAWASWGKVRRHAAPRAWVVRTALNLGVSWWRRFQREVPLAEHDAAVPAGTGDGVDPTLIAALRRLPARQREVLALRIFLDLDTQTTAKVIGIAPGTVMAHLSRAVAALRRDLPHANSDSHATEVIQ